jgi:hypothetical protein
MDKVKKPSSSESQNSLDSIQTLNLLVISIPLHFQSNCQLYLNLYFALHSEGRTLTTSLFTFQWTFSPAHVFLAEVYIIPQQICHKHRPQAVVYHLISSHREQQWYVWFPSYGPFWIGNMSKKILQQIWIKHNLIGPNGFMDTPNSVWIPYKILLKLNYRLSWILQTVLSHCYVMSFILFMDSFLFKIVNMHSELEDLFHYLCLFGIVTFIGWNQFNSIHSTSFLSLLSDECKYWLPKPTLMFPRNVIHVWT